MRALNLAPRPEPSQDATAAQRRWTERQRELEREIRLDRFLTILERIAVALERRAS